MYLIAFFDFQNIALIPTVVIRWTEEEEDAKSAMLVTLHFLAFNIEIGLSE